LDRAAHNHYSTGESEEIKARDVLSIAPPDCVPFLRGPAPIIMLPAVEVMEVGVLDEALCRGRATERLLPAVLTPSLFAERSPALDREHAFPSWTREGGAHCPRRLP